MPIVAVLGPGRRSPLVLPRPPSFVATHDFFSHKSQISDLFAFPNFRKFGKFAVSIERRKTKSASASSPPVP